MQEAKARSESAAQREARLARANINPSTGLATDYLNHFNEAIMLLEMLSASPDCVNDFLAWRPLSYREHFSHSRLRDRDLVVEAYETADPVSRSSLEALATAMNAVLEEARNVLQADPSALESARLAERSASWLRPLVERAGAIINGECSLPDGSVPQPQSVVDQLLKP